MSKPVVSDSIVLVSNQVQSADLESASYDRRDEAEGEAVILPKLCRLFFLFTVFGALCGCLVVAGLNDQTSSKIAVESDLISPKWLCLPAFLGVLYSLIGMYTADQLASLEREKGVVNLESPERSFKRKLSNLKLMLCFGAVLSMPTAALFWVIGNAVMESGLLVTGILSLAAAITMIILDIQVKYSKPQ